MMNKSRKSLFNIVLVVVGVIAINLIASKLYYRFDLTKDKRYTLSNTSKDVISAIDSPLIIDVFLEGDLPSEFKILRNETKQVIEEFSNSTSEVFVNYINPTEDEATRQRNIEELSKSGLQPYVNTTNINGKVTQELIFPWAFASYKGNTVKIPLLKQSITEDLQKQINNSVQNLEYTFTDAFTKLIKDKEKTIAVLKGNGELNDIYITDFLQTIRPYYNIAPFTLDSVATNPKKTLKSLNQFDLIVVAKPTEAFSENEKLVLDQYLMNGGNSLWLTESVLMDKDSLYNDTGASVAVLKDLNLNDFFFSYGVRVNPSIVKDLYSAPIMLSIGEGSRTQMQPIQWQYSPLSASNQNHPVTKNLELVKFDFASPIDTLKNSIKKTILLQSSPKSKLQGVPTRIALSDVTTDPDVKSFNQGPLNLAVLLEGEFKSVYKNRVLPFKNDDYKDESLPAKMVIISDGNIIKNEVFKKQPQPLGFDRLTGKDFGNKEFLLNVVNYLLDDNGLINLRAKDISIAYLDSDKIESKKNTWQLVNLILPLVLLGVFGFVFSYFRRKKYAS